MSTDEHIQQAIEIGTKNKQTLELIRNWCAHISVKKMGGGGIVEQETGLPIGPRALECQHAAASGFAGHDLAGIAVDFYDRNCFDCKFRKPVSIPNISILVGERDQNRERQRLESELFEKASADRLAAREAERKRIRPDLDPVSVTTLDLISALDSKRATSTASTIIKTAKLAHDAFPRPIIDHLFSLADTRDSLLVDTALASLAELPVEESRLCRSALRALADHLALKTAAKIVKTLSPYADEALIPGAVQALASLANPVPFPFGGGHRRDIDKEPLLALFQYHKSAVETGLRQLLESRTGYDVRTATRGIVVLNDVDPALVHSITDMLVAKLVRAKWLLEGRSGEVEEALTDVRAVVALAFLDRPTDTQAVFRAYLEGANAGGIAQVMSVYDDALHGLRFSREDRKPEILEAHRLAFRELVVAATEDRRREPGDSTFGLFSGEPYELTPLTAEFVDLLLGSAAIIDGRLDATDEPNLVGTNPLAGLERFTRRRHQADLQRVFVRWACVGAGQAGASAIQKVLGFLQRLPEKSDRLRPEIIGNFDALMKHPEGLKLCLPDFYAALVGPSQLVRSEAASALGKMRGATQKNLPNLVYEAFTALLSDTYLIVHQTAVRALERFEMPAEFDATVRSALVNLINYYTRTKSHEEFLITAIDLFAHRYVEKEDLKESIGDALLSIFMGLKPSVVAREFRYGRRIYMDNPHYYRLLFRLLNDDEAMSLYHEDLIEVLYKIPSEVVHRERAELLTLGIKLASRYRQAIGVFIETLSLAGAWREAATFARSLHSAIPDTTHNKPWRLHAELFVVACGFEFAISAGDQAGLESLAKQWRSTISDIERDSEENKERRDPLRGLCGSN